MGGFESAAIVSTAPAEALNRMTQTAALIGNVGEIRSHSHAISLSL
jgi:hypothetical protein